MTLKQIAAELGISYSTVSRVINGYERNFSVKPELRARILEKIRETQFSPDPLYRSLRKKNNRQISFIFPFSIRELEGTVVGDAVYYLEEKLSRNRFQFHYLFNSREAEATYRLPPWKAAGFIVPDVRSPEQVGELEKSDVPYVVLNGVCGGKGTAVMTDDLWNMTRAMDYLFSLGHTRIGYLNCNRISSPPELRPHSSITDRRAAYLEFCSRHGMEPLNGYDDRKTPTEFNIRSLLEQNASAVIAYDLPIAIEAVHALWKLRIRIPEDVSVLCFNNHRFAEYMVPPLTTLEIPAKEMGEAAADIIMKRHVDPEYARGKTVSFRGKLIVRQSTGAYRK